jgi:hypothetical protein
MGRTGREWRMGMGRMRENGNEKVWEVLEWERMRGNRNGKEQDIIGMRRNKRECEWKRMEGNGKDLANVNGKMEGNGNRKESEGIGIGKSGREGKERNGREWERRGVNGSGKIGIE